MVVVVGFSSLCCPEDWLPVDSMNTASCTGEYNHQVKEKSGEMMPAGKTLFSLCCFPPSLSLLPLVHTEA